MGKVDVGEVDGIPWLDRPGYKDLIREKQLAGQIDEEGAAACTFFADEGYLIVPGLIASDQLDRAWAGYEDFYQENREEFFESSIPEDPWPERYLNTHNCVPEIKEILEHSKLLHITDMIFGRKTRPFQTITSHKGTEQPAHSDSIHMTTDPPGYLTAAWIAFEDLEPDCGLLEYYPRSHRLPYLLSDDVGIEGREFQEEKYDVYKRSYEPAVAQTPVKAIREASPPARRGFTLADQVNQLVGASEADPDRGFMARTMALCSLPRSNPGNRLQYKRVNGPFTLYMTVTGGNKLPFGNLPRLILAWLCTEAVRTQNRELVLGKSLADFMRALGVYSTSGGKYTRLRNQMKRLFGVSSRNGKNRTLSHQKQLASALNRRVCEVSVPTLYNSIWCSRLSFAAGLIYVVSLT